MKPAPLHLTTAFSLLTLLGIPPAPKAEALTGEALYNSDKAPDSMLYDYPQEVIEGV